MTDKITEWIIKAEDGKIKETFKTEQGFEFHNLGILERSRGNGKTTAFQEFITEELESLSPIKPDTHPINILHGKTSDIINKIMNDIDHLVVPLVENGTDIFIGASVDPLRLNEKAHTFTRMKKYPHNCFGCGKKLSFSELSMTNFGFELKQLKKMWKSKDVEFFCCMCFRKGPDVEKIMRKKNRLKKKAKRLCEKFGFDLEEIKDLLK